MALHYTRDEVGQRSLWLSHSRLCDDWVAQDAELVRLRKQLEVVEHELKLLREAAAEVVEQVRLAAGIKSPPQDGEADGESSHA